MTRDERRSAGLCRDCAHHRVTGNRAGSRFYLCKRAKLDPRYPKYPPLPVVECAGYEPGAEDAWERFAREAGE